MSTFIRKASYPLPTRPDLRDSSLVGAWLSKSSVGAKDASVYAYDLTRSGSPRQERIGMYFGGVSDYLSRAVMNYRGSDSAGTISGWIRTPAMTGADRVIFSSSDTSSTSKFLMFKVNTSGVFCIVTRDGALANTVYFTRVVSDNVWRHFMITSSGTAYTMIIDGVADVLAGGTNNGDWFHDASGRDNIVIAAQVRSDGMANPFLGEIRDIQVSSEQKSLSWARYQYSLGVPESDLVVAVDDGTEDLSVYRHAITNSSGPAAILGKGVEIPAANENAYIQIGAVNNLNTRGNNGFTVYECIKLGRVGVGQTLLNITGATGAGNKSWSTSVTAADRVSMLTNDGAASSSLTGVTTALIAGKLYVLTFVYDGGTTGTNGHIYINGVLEIEGTISRVPQLSTNYAMRFGTDYTRDASIDLVGSGRYLRYYNTPHSAGRVKHYYNFI